MPRFHQRDARNALFSSYDQARSRPSSAASGSPAPPRSSSRNAPYASSPYGVNGSDPSSTYNAYPPSGGGFSAYPGNSSEAVGRSNGDGGFRSATPDKKGQYSDAVLSELESQNDDQASEMSKKVKMLKDVSINSSMMIGQMLTCYSSLWLLATKSATALHWPRR